MSANKNRFKLLLIVALFALPLIAAIALHASGWRPSGTRNFGVLIEPPQDLKGLSVILDSDGQYAWHTPNYAWTLLVRVPSDCAADCLARLQELLRVRLALGRHATRLRMLLLDRTLDGDTHKALAPFQFGAGREPRLAELTPGPAQDLAAWLVDDDGYLALHYPPGFARAGLRKDLARLIR